MILWYQAFEEVCKTDVNIGQSQTIEAAYYA